MKEPSNLKLTIESHRWFPSGATVVAFGLPRDTWAETGEPAGDEEQAAVA